MNVRHKLPAQARNSFLWLLTAILLFGSGHCLAEENRPYEPGERLVYDVKVGGTVAAKGVLSVGTPRRWRGKPTLPFLGELTSVDFWKNAYPVDDRIMSLVDSTNSPVRTEMKIRERKLHRDFTIQYNRKKNRATGTKKVGNKKKKSFKKQVPAHSQDMLSWFYRMRTLDLKDGGSYSFTGFSGNFVYDINCKVVGRENVRTKIGDKNAFKIKTTVTRRGGRKPFKKLVMFWIGTDAKRTPIKAVVDFKVGHVEAILSSVQRATNSGTQASATSP
jgi:ribosomal protein S8E